MLEEYKKEDEAQRMGNGRASSGAFGPTDFSGLMKAEKAGGSGLKTPQKVIPG